jgi:hypothetical protein
MGTSGGSKGDFRGQFGSAYKEVKKYKKNKRNSRM